MAGPRKNLSKHSAGRGAPPDPRGSERKDAREKPLEIRTQVPLRPLPRDRGMELSFAQQRLWMLEQFDPGSTAYYVRSAFRVSGALDESILQRSIDEMVRRHEILRTTFRQKNGDLVQVIAPEESAQIRKRDLRELPETIRALNADRLIDDAVHRPFDLVQGPLLRITLLQLDEREYVLVFLFHHIIVDDWSRRIFFRELSALYAAFSSGEPSPLQALFVQYADFAIWQREWLRADVRETKLSYWKQKLKDVPPPLALPADKPRSRGQGRFAARLRSELPGDLTRAIRGLCLRQGATPFMALLAAFKILIHRHTNRDDIIVGTPIAGRTHVEIEKLIGCFVNTLVLRTDLSGNPSYLQLLARVRETALGAYEHQDLPFEMLVEELQPARNRGGDVFFSIFFNMLSGERQRLPLKGLRVEEIPFFGTEVKFDLSLYACDRGETIEIDLVYNTGMFSRQRISSLADQLHYLLAQVVTDPERPLRSYSLVTPSSSLILPDPHAPLEAPHYAPVTEMIAERASKDPAHDAVCQGVRSLSYSELVERSQTVAKVLVAKGMLGGGDVVAVCGMPSIGLIVAILGVFLGGGVLLTLDPQLPEYRRRLMIAEAKARHIVYVDAAPLTEAHFSQGEFSSCTQIMPDSGSVMHAAGFMPSPESAPLPMISPSAPAYIFFTSGTTGVPKGVLGSHKGLSHFLDWQGKTFRIGPSDRFAQLTALSFDAVLRDIFTPLTHGATLCLPDNDDMLSPDIPKWLSRENISVLHIVPSVAQSWLSHAPQGTSLNNLRLVFFAGEPLTDTLVRSWRSSFPHAHTLVNLYGPTETTLVKCFYVLPDDIVPGVQPLGRPLPETQILVLGDEDRPCGVGEPGEIVIRTPFMTYGYINAAGQKKSRFVPNPFLQHGDDMLYYSGDRGCFRPDGILLSLGRLDDQLKVRGVRIEPGEIESILVQHPSVRRAFVTAREDRKSEKQLTAYIVADRISRVSADVIRNFAGKMLPRHMIPSFFVFLDAFPLTPVGKLDRKALPDPEETRESGEDALTPPRTATELIVSEIWTEVLGPAKVGARSDFFQLGGHSLMATRVISRLSERFTVTLSLRDIFEAPTISALSELIETRLSGSVDSRRAGSSGETAMEEGRL